MKKPGDFNHLFDASGNIKREVLLKYLHGEVSREEKHFIEQQMANDPFTRDAVEGLTMIPDKKELRNRFSSLDSVWRRRLQYVSSPIRKRKKEASSQWLGIAAMVLVLLGILSVLKVIRDNMEKDQKGLAKGITVMTDTLEEPDKVTGNIHNDTIPEKPFMAYQLQDKKPKEIQKVPEEVILSHRSNKSQVAEIQPELEIVEESEWDADDMAPDSLINLTSSQTAGPASSKTDKPLMETTREESLSPATYQKMAFPGETNSPEFVHDRYQTFSAYVMAQLPADMIKQLSDSLILSQITFSEKGKITNATIRKGVNPEMDSMVLKIIHHSPKWQFPVKPAGPVTVTVPIGFKKETQHRY